VEYALFEGRFWLPKIRTAEGIAQISFARLPFELQQTFNYLTVNGAVDVPEIPLTAAMARVDSIALRDSLAAVDDPAARARADSLTAALETRTDAPSVEELRRRAAAGDAQATIELSTRARRAAGCDSAASQTRMARTANRSTRIMLTATCNDSLLVNSEYLPPSIYSQTEELASTPSRDALLEKLGPGLQARFSPRLPALNFGFGDGMLRYNRVEGFSPALGLTQVLGAGLTATGTIRGGISDGHLNAELSLMRRDGTNSFTVTGYKRLVAMNDWGNPLSFGSSFVALVGGRDEGFYYRARGAEVEIAAPGNPNISFGLYGERQTTAHPRAKFSLAAALGDHEFGPNIAADEGDIFGGSFTLRHSLGADPRGFRVMTLVKGENGMGDYIFGRGLVDATLSHTLFGRFSAALTLSAGSSTGVLPMQRSFMLGGTQSVRGQRSGTAFGDAFWMTRVEVGSAKVAARRVLFADFGWAGSREDWSRQSRALNGVGIGWSFLDGLIRGDISRGIYPGKSWRFASYLEARF